MQWWNNGCICERSPSEPYADKLTEEAVNTMLWVQTSITIFAHFLGKQTIKEKFASAASSFTVCVFLLIFWIYNQVIPREKINQLKISFRSSSKLCKMFTLSL